MGIYRDKQTRNYGIRIEYYSHEYKKIIGPDRRKAELALFEAKQEIRLAKLCGQKWQGFQKLQRAIKPKTFIEAAKDYVEERANCKSSSLASYKSILTAHLLPEFGRQGLVSISESQIKKYQVKLSENVSPSRVNTIMQLLRSILDQAWRRGEIDRDPTKAVRRVQEPKAKIDPLSEDELELALSKIERHYRPLFITLAFTGARPNELLALRFSDIDWKREYIHITKGRVRGAEGLPKTKSAERMIPISERVKETLLELKERNLISKENYVFTKPDGQPIDKHLDRIWSKALKKAELRHRPSYQLRHTFATQCIIKGFPLPFIAKVLGHSTIDTLIRHYASWIDSESSIQEARLRNAFRKGDPKSSKQMSLASAV